MKELHILTDMQYGSCGKGLFAGYLAKQLQPDLIVTAWGPNSGHTYIDAEGRKSVNIALPNGIGENKGALRYVLLGPGSIINPQLLMSELEAYADMMDGVALIIHPHAAVVTEMHRQLEAEYGFQIGSTMKGVGEAVINKIRRINPNIAAELLKGTPLESCVVSVEEYNDILDSCDAAILEGAQGFSLSLNQGFYPHVTSRDCTTHQLMSDCGIPAGVWLSGGVHVYGVARTYPIRVANRYDKEGRQIGWSGPCYWDQEEIKWEDLGLEPELTTVTKLPRRIFTFSAEQIRMAIRMNGIRHVFLNFCNYPEEPNRLTHAQMFRAIESFGAEVRWIGNGPCVTDIVGV